MGCIPAIKSVSNTKEFFYDLVKSSDIILNSEIEFYLVELLCHPPQVTQPVAMLFKDAVEAPPSQQIKNFKLMGDVSLAVSGLWPESLKRKPVKIDYFVTMGQTGYNHAAHVAKSHLNDLHFYDFFSRLCDDFSVCRNVLEEVAGALRPL